MSPRPPQSMHPPQEKRTDIGLDSIRKIQHAAEPASSPKMSPSRDISGDTVSAAEKETARASHSPAPAQQSPSCDTPDDVVSIKDKKHPPSVASTPSAEHPLSPNDTTNTTSPDKASPIDRKIDELENCLGITAPLSTAVPDETTDLNLQKLSKTLDLTPMQPLMDIFKATGKMSDPLHEDLVVKWFASADFLPFVIDWKEDCYDNANMEEALSFALHSSDHPSYTPDAQQLACCALYLHDIQAGKVKFDHEQREAMLACAKFVRRLARSMEPYILHYLSQCMFPDVELFLFEWSARALITVYGDLIESQTGFFSILFETDLVNPMTPEARIAWEETLGIAAKPSKGKSSEEKPPKEKAPKAERYTPSIAIQRAAVSVGHALQPTLSQNAKDIGSLKISTKSYPIYRHFSDLQLALNAEAEDFPQLLTAFSKESPLGALPAVLPKKTETHRALCGTHGSAKAKPKRKRKTSITAAPSQKKHASEGTHFTPNHQNKREDKGKTATKSKKFTTQKPEVTNRSPDAAEIVNIAQLEAARPSPHGQEDEDLVSDKTTEDVTEQNVVVKPVDDRRFYTSEGRIKPTRRTVAASLEAESFDEFEELILYQRYKALVTAAQDDEVELGVSEKWWKLWLAIAYCLPGRGVMECIAFYKANQQHFQLQ